MLYYLGPMLHVTLSLNMLMVFKKDSFCVISVYDVIADKCPLDNQSSENQKHLKMRQKLLPRHHLKKMRWKIRNIHICGAFKSVWFVHIDPLSETHHRIMWPEVKKNQLKTIKSLMLLTPQFPSQSNTHANIELSYFSMWLTVMGRNAHQAYL